MPRLMKIQPLTTQAQLGDDSEDMADLIQSLQGQWEDDVGLNIKVTGNEVDTLMNNLFVACCSLSVVAVWMLVVGCCLLVVACWLLLVGCCGCHCGCCLFLLLFFLLAHLLLRGPHTHE